MSESNYGTMGFAIDAAKLKAENMGWTIEKRIGDDWQAMQYETYQTRFYTLHRSGRVSKQCLNVTLYRLPSGRYELVSYIN